DYRNDFIELFNRGANPVNLTGWTVQYASATGSNWDTTPLSGILQPGQYYLIQQGQGSGGTTNLPTPDATGGIAINATSGKVALVSNNTPPTSATPAIAAPIVDLVGYGTATHSLGDPAPGIGNTTALARNNTGCANTNNNAADFTGQSPAPRNRATPQNSCTTPPPPPPPPNNTPPTPTALRFVPLTPCRLMETRALYNFEGRTGAFGPPALNAAETRTLTLPASNVCAIPTTARAYVVNVTVLPSTAVDFVTLWPAGDPRPDFWTIRSPDGQAVANSAIVKANASGAINVFASDRTDLLIDISGYYTDSVNPAQPGLAYYPLTPCRVIETRAPYRSPAGPFGPPALTAGETRKFRIPATPYCSVPVASAYSVTITVVPPAPLAFLTAWPDGVAQPGVSSINSFAGRVLANSVIVPAASDGSINVYAYNNSDLIVDINGYFAPDDGQRGLFYYPVTQCRANDSRTTGAGIYPDESSRSIAVPSSAGCSGIPTTAQAYAVNVTAIPDGNPMPFLTAWPTGSPRPGASILNAFQGQTVTNSAIVPTGANGTIDVYAYRRTNVVVEISGYFGR
ncbi:MAG: lamin tail domain-containing protein, partial [Bryobacterales bacterium]|nr:lamin tail domain-containing protein [Bryobacterales bacterium]